MARPIEIKVRVSEEGVTFQQLGQEGEAAFNQIGGGAQKLERATQQLQRTAGTALAGIGAAMTAVSVKSISMARDFNRGFREVNTLLDISSSGLADLKQQVLDLDPALGSTKDLTEGLYQTISAGIDEPQAALGFLEKAAVAAKAGVSDLGLAVQAGTKVLAGMGLEASESERVFDQLFATVRVGQTRFGELAPEVGNLAAVAGELNITLPETLGSLARLTRVSGSTSEAGTRLNRVFVSLIKPTSAMQDQLAKVATELGLSEDATASMIIEQIGLTETMRRVTAEARGNEQEMGKLFGRVRALQGALGLANGDFQETEGLIGDISDSSGDAAEAFDEVRSTMDTFRNTLERTGVIIGGSLLPAVNAVVKPVTALLQAFNDLDPTLQKVIGGIGGVAGIVSTAAGGFLLMLPRIQRTRQALATLRAAEAAGDISRMGGAAASSAGKVARLTGVLGKAGLVGAVGAASFGLGALINKYVIGDQALADLLSTSERYLGVLDQTVPGFKMLRGVVGEIPPAVDAADRSMRAMAAGMETARSEISQVNAVAEQFRGKNNEVVEAVRSAVAAGQPYNQILAELTDRFAEGTDTGDKLRAVLALTAQEHETLRKKAEPVPKVLDAEAAAAKRAKEEMEKLTGALDSLGIVTAQDVTKELQALERVMRSDVNVTVEQSRAIVEKLRAKWEELGLLTPEVKRQLDLIHLSLGDVNTSVGLTTTGFEDTQAAMDFAIPTIDQAKESFEKHEEATHGATIQLGNFFDTINTGNQLLDNLISSVGNFIATLIGGGGLGEALGAASSGIAGLIGSIGGTTGGILGNIFGALTGGGGGGGIGSLLGGLLGGGGGGGGIGSLLSGLLGGGGQLLAPGAGLGGLLGSLFGGGGAVNLTGSLGAGLGIGGGGGILGGITGALSSAVGAAGSAFASIGSSIAGFIGSGLLGASTFGVGAVVPLLLKFLGGPSTMEKAADEIGKTLGDRFSESINKNLLRSIGKTGIMGRESTDRFANLRFMLGNIIEEAGLAEGELDTVIQTARETFTALDLGNLNAAESAEALRKSLGQIVPEMVRLGASQDQVKALGDVYRDMLNRVRLGHLSAADAAKVLEGTFPQLEAAADSFGAQGKRMLVDIAAAMDELGISGADAFRQLANTGTAEMAKIAAESKKTSTVVSDELSRIRDDAFRNFRGMAGDWQSAMNDMIGDAEDMQQQLVGGSIIPDTVDAIEDEWDRARHAAELSAQGAVDAWGKGTRTMADQVRHLRELLQMGMTLGPQDMQFLHKAELKGFQTSLGQTRVVPGSRNQARLGVVHGGEEITRRARGRAGGGVTVIIRGRGGIEDLVDDIEVVQNRRARSSR